VQPCMPSYAGQPHQGWAGPSLLQRNAVIKGWDTVSSCLPSSVSSRRRVALGGLELPRHLLCQVTQVVSRRSCDKCCGTCCAVLCCAVLCCAVLQAADLMKEWAAIDIADALELLSPDFKNHEVRAHAVATLQVRHAHTHAHD